MKNLPRKLREHVLAEDQNSVFDTHSFNFIVISCVLSIALDYRWTLDIFWGCIKRFSQ